MCVYAVGANIVKRVGGWKCHSLFALKEYYGSCHQ